MTKIDRQLARAFRQGGLLFATAGLALITGCATGGGKAAPKYVFYPPGSQAPRLQYLASFSEEKDLGLEIDSFTTFVTGMKQDSQPILKPYGAILWSNQLLVCDTGARAIDILDLAHKTMRQFSPLGAGKLGTPINIAADADGTRYVTDTGRNQVLIYGADDSYLGVVDESDSQQPTGVALTANRIYVTDLKGHCVRVYEKAGRKPLFTIPRNPKAEESEEPGKLFMPVNLTIDSSGRVYVSDMAVCRVQIYDADGKHLRSVGSRGDLPGQFARPKGAAVDREARLYVVDAATQLCQIFDSEGRLLLCFGEPDGGIGALNLPASVSVDYEHVGLFQKYAAPDFALEYLVVVSNQYGPHKVNVYGLGHKKKA